MTKSAVAYWVSQLNAAVAALATRTSERDSARNGLYVGGTYLSGPTWQAQDAADAAALAAQIIATAAATPPALDTIAGSGVTSSFSTSLVTTMTLTVNRTGFWAAVAGVQIGGPYPDHAGIFYNGVEQASVTLQAAPLFGYGIFVDPTLITNGQAITLQLRNDGGQASSVSQQFLRAWFVPTPAYPH